MLLHNLSSLLAYFSCFICWIFIYINYLPNNNVLFYVTVDTTSIVYIPMIGLWVTPNGRGMLYMSNYNTKYHLLPNPICI